MLSSGFEGISHIQIQKRIDLIQVTIYIGFPNFLRQNCLKRPQNWKRPPFQREDGLFTFHLMVRGELKAK
ncbi:30S ribosomal protein S3, chloroplastic [Apostasia shenzhenica]|uniref:30S ribosomal protein S3, chloroplastic n=1 Tax=Apostasia shenzhenica TaxID=1088818 RepID=A0A2I0AWE1_9ASPA|nr:30S ribosomal protein S3, chloroplastic [Apostasia shenzhenica]